MCSECAAVCLARVTDDDAGRVADDDNDDTYTAGAVSYTHLDVYKRQT